MLRMTILFSPMTVTHSCLVWSDLVICCGPLRAQSFLIPCRAGAKTKFFCLTTLESFSLIWCGRLLLALTSTVILGSGLHRTHHHIFLSHDSDLLWSGTLLLAFTITVILGSGPHRNHDHIFMFLHSGLWDYSLVGFQFRINCCWSLPAQSFLVMWPMTICFGFRFWVNYCWPSFWTVLIYDLVCISCCNF
jgi:hypothetical protein